VAGPEPVAVGGAHDDARSALLPGLAQEEEREEHGEERQDARPAGAGLALDARARDLAARAHAGSGGHRACGSNQALASRLQRTQAPKASAAGPLVTSTQLPSSSHATRIETRSTSSI